MKPAYKTALSAAAVIAVAVLIGMTGLDIKAQNLLYDAQTGSWKYALNPVVDAMYKYGTIPAVVMSLLCIIVFSLGFGYERFVKYRKPAAVFILTMLLGPGLLINVVLKSYSGRPRPRDVAEFGGSWKFKNQFEFGVPGRGQSFPCGHCSTGFVFAALYFALRRDKKLAAAANSALGFALVYGAIMGAGRMAQGAHFLSDVYWAGVITLYTAYFADKAVSAMKYRETENCGDKTMSWAILGTLTIFMAMFFLLAVPFYKEKKHDVDTGASRYLSVFMNVYEAETDIKGESSNRVRVEFSSGGFGFPRSGCDDRFEIKDGASGAEVDYGVAAKGFITELRADIKAYLPAKKLKLTVNSGGGDIKYAAAAEGEALVLYTKKGDIFFTPGPGSKLSQVFLKTKAGDVYVTLGPEVAVSSPCVFDIRAENGRVYIRNNSRAFKDLNLESDKLKGAKELIFRSKSGRSMDIKTKYITVEK